MNITPQQEEILKQYLDVFNKDGKVIDRNGSQSFEDFDKSRSDAVPKLREMVLKFLSKEMSLSELKERSNRLALDYNFWGFTGMSGQMQLNQYANHFSDTEDGADILRSVISIPKDINEAREKINNFGTYLRNVRSSAETTRGLPWDRQAFLLSYFWEIQEPEKFPIYYKSSRDTLTELGFNLENHDTHGDEYVAFIELIETLYKLFVEFGTENQHPVWFVEHVLWYSKLKNTPDTKQIYTEKPNKQKGRTVPEHITTFAPSSWLPPIVSDLSPLAQNNETEWSKERGVKAEKAFETKLSYIFTLLGYDVTELGQGTGREPDGIARSSQAQNGYYAIVYDAKARGEEYSFGTDDRSIIEYIQKKKVELERQRISKMYFVLISSEFSDSQKMDDIVQNIYVNTQVPVILLRADDLLFITEEKLKNVEIDHTLLEYLFLQFGRLTRDKIIGVLGA